MYLELADNYLEDNAQMLPMVDPRTGEILMINAETFSMLTPQEQIEVESQAPFLIMKMSEGQMSEGLFAKISEKVGGIVANFREKITGDANTPILPWKRNGQTQPTTGVNPDPRFAFSANLEPDPKPWFARPEVMLPIVGGVVLLGAFAMRKK